MNNLTPSNRRPAFWLAPALVTLLLTACVVAVAGTEETVRVEGAVATPQKLTLAQLKDRFATEIHPVEYTSKGEKHTANCIPLLSLLKTAGVPTDFKPDPKADPKIKNLPLRYLIVVQARDGYVAAFSLAELLPTVGGRDAWLALDVDGKPLSEQDGPIKLIVPQDQKPSRSVHGIELIRVIDGANVPTTQPDR